MTLLDELEALGPDGLDRYVEDVRRRVAARLPPTAAEYLVSFGVLMVLADVVHECANEVERKLILH